MTSHEVEAAFEAFVRQRGRHLLRSAWLLTGDRHRAEDLAQETLTRLYQAWGRRRTIENPSGYAQTTLVNTFLSWRRRHSSSETPVADPPESAVEERDVALEVAVRAALLGLSPLDRAIVIMRYFEDASVEVTASAVGLSPGAVRNRAMRALRELRNALTETPSTRGEPR